MRRHVLAAMALGVLVVLALGGAGCAQQHGTFGCHTDEQCVNAGAQGTCEMIGFCSFPDPSCDLGRRYADYTPLGLADECVRIDHTPDAAPPPGTPDAAPRPDAPVEAPDAKPGKPDAMPPPDARPHPDAMLPPDAKPGDPDAAPRPDATPPPDAAPPPDATPPTVTVSFGETGADTFSGVTTDTWIDSMNPTFNSGKSVELRTDADPLRHILMRFELGAIPPGAKVISAELHVWTDASGGLTTGTIQIFRLLEAWNGGLGNGAAGVANWNERTAGVTWTNAGAGTPTSRDGTSIAEFAPSKNDTEYVVTLAKATVQGWVTTPTTNDGMIFVGHNASNLSVLLHSSESTTNARRPRLVIKYHL